jgi:Xaa-Pro aminopeptidase
VDGWLFYNFHHIDPLADSILEIDAEAVNSRRWFYAVPVDGQPIKIIHRVEAGILGGLPGLDRPYSTHNELCAELASLGGKAWACDFSKSLPVISFMDGGTLELLRAQGLRCVEADKLIQALRGALTPEGLASHESSARILYAAVAEAWGFISQRHLDGKPLYERDIQNNLVECIHRAGLVFDHPPIVAAGSASADPHYALSGSGRSVSEGDAIQLDLWAKGQAPGDVYADISWIGVYAPEPTPAQARAATDLFSARDRALSFIREGLERGAAVSGAEVDRATRDYLHSLGYGNWLRHRTGHSIDIECHGSGANLDSVEFPDDRALAEGSCFSIEPGIYGQDFGFRTEIDAYIQSGRLCVSGLSPQTKLLTCK